MEIILVGGPYNGEWVNMVGDELNPPISVLLMSPILKPLTNAGIEQRADIFTLFYKLERVKTLHNTWHYEYRYQNK